MQKRTSCLLLPFWIYWRKSIRDSTNSIKPSETNVRALQIREGILGKNHPQVAILLNNLVEIYHAQGKYEEAEPLIDRALHIHEKAFGSEHSDTAFSYYNRAENFSLRRNYEEAESYYKKALTIREKALGDSSTHRTYLLSTCKVLC